MNEAIEPANAEQKRQDQLLRSAGVASGAVFLSRITGLVREVAMAGLFGASMSYDAFTLGFRIPNLMRDLFAEGALSSAFVPIFTRKLKDEGLEQAARLANLVACMLVLVVGGLCLLGVIFSPQILEFMAGGFSAVPGKQALAVRLTRIMFPFLLLVALAAQAMGILNALNQFAVPAFSSTFFNLGSVGIGLLLALVVGPGIGMDPIEGMAWGVVAGGALQLWWQIPSLAKSGFRFQPALDFGDPGVREILRLMGPAILGNAAVQINVMVNTNFASSLTDPLRGPDGPVSWLGYAFRFMQLPLGLFGVAIASATLPAVSRSAARGDMPEFRQTLARSIAFVFLLTIPSSVGLALLGPAMIGAIYEVGEFNAYDTRQTGVALSCFAIGLAGYAALKVLTPAFYALQDSRTPMLISVASIAINYVAAAGILRGLKLGHAGLALSTSIVAMFGFGVSFLILRNRIAGLEGRALARSTIRIVAASVVMGVVVQGSTSLIQQLLGVSKAARIADLLVSVPLGALVFWLAARWLGVPELGIATRAFAGPMERASRMLHSLTGNRLNQSRGHD